MRRYASAAVLGAVVLAAALSTIGASATDGSLRVGFASRTITPIGQPPEGWNFWVNPVTGVWSEQFDDRNGNGYYDPPNPRAENPADRPGEAFVDDPANTLLDPQSAGEFDGCWTNAGFSGRGPLGKYDDVWARAIVTEAGGYRVAIVSLDAVGFFYEEIERIRAELEQVAPNIDEIIVSSTHTHESCDTMGYWGNPLGTDGKFPLWQSFIRARIVEAVAEAESKLEPAAMKAATVKHTIPIRDSRPPVVVDPDLQIAQFVRAEDPASVIGTIVNWSNHPEALASGNRYISSDFPHGTRERLESLFPGSTAIYFSGSVGGLMTPLGVNMGTDPETGEVYGSTPTKNRAYYIGKLVADQAVAGLANAPVERPAALDLVSKEIFMSGDNVALRALNIAGVFDKPTYQAGLPADRAGDEFKTQVVAVGLGSLRFQTVPGELFPEIEIGGYGRADCPQADTGRPHEPVIRDQWQEQHLFTLGLAQDELGYIVPGYDFWMFGAPNDAPRPLIDVGGLEREDPCGDGHYEETVSASSVMAPVVACTIAELAGKDPWNDLENYPACSSENTTVGPQGTHLP